MKPYARLFFIFLTINQLQAQPLFSKIQTGQVVSTPSDSRSVNWIDVNGDGFDDLFISNGPKTGQNNLLYLNNGDGTFSPVTDDPIVKDNSPSDGATFADADNDGDADAYVVTWYGKINYTYANQGDGSFLQLAPGVSGNASTYSETAAWGDYDNDGLLDLYVTNSEGAKRNLLYRNLGNNQFEKINTGTPVTETDLSRCATWVDYDNDGDADLFVTNEDNQANDLYRNEGGGQFTKITADPLVTGGLSSMSASWGDIDNDGDLDVFIANSGFYAEQTNQLYRNNGDGTFTQITPDAFTSAPGCSYGSAFGDIDNDGDIDLAVANGFCNGAIRNFLFFNDGQGHFSPAPDSIADLSTPSSYGIAFADYDLDGFLDLAIATCKNTDQSAMPNNLLYHNNQSPAQGGSNPFHWLRVRLEGQVSNRSGIGAKVRIKTSQNGESRWQMREISAQTGYCGQNSLVAHFGLGQADLVDSIVVEWPSGIRQIQTGIAADQLVYLLESNPVAVKTTFDALNSIRVFPNPADTRAAISAVWQKRIPELTVTLIDSLGRKLLSDRYRDLHPGQWTAQLEWGETLAPGNYFVRLASESQAALIPLILK